jgi:hypothetical protein
MHTTCRDEPHGTTMKVFCYWARKCGLQLSEFRNPKSHTMRLWSEVYLGDSTFSITEDHKSPVETSWENGHSIKNCRNVW